MTSLTLVRRIAARPPIVFDALTTADGIACWWGPDAGPVLLAETDIRIGGHFRVRFRMLDDGEPEEAGEVSRVEIDLRPIDTGTELTFTHSRLRTEASRSSHRQGWNGALDKLVRHLANGPG